MLKTDFFNNVLELFFPDLVKYSIWVKLINNLYITVYYVRHN